MKTKLLVPRHKTSNTKETLLLFTLAAFYVAVLAYVAVFHIAS